MTQAHLDVIHRLSIAAGQALYAVDEGVREAAEKRCRGYVRDLALSLGVEVDW